VLRALQDGNLECFVWDGYGDASCSLFGDHSPSRDAHGERRTVMGPGVVIAVTVLTVIIGLFGSAVYLIMQARSGRSMKFSLAGFLVVYVYVAAFLGMLVVAIGGSQAVNAGLSKAISPEFSYGRQNITDVSLVDPEQDGSSDSGQRQQEAQQSGDDQKSKEQQVAREDRRLENEFRVGLWQGLAMAIAGAVIYGFHLAARLLLGAMGRMRELRVGYLCVMLAVFGLVTIISIPAAIAQTMEHVVQIPGDYLPGAGADVANVIVCTPIWLVVLTLLLRQVRRPVV